ncbi:hypothetical protein [Marinitoga aeolica]|uniref:CBM20 domain-containing protein n=1 Tax=Marinitoga aeolica TaxID=2809031 RepID=A0ABY8PN41_9BACT|nr:hypothetical protein [Marinitoga aeolica]WGS64048.1 hypothetical protein JRV97_06600 [Marinitoga aeolica]
MRKYWIFFMLIAVLSFALVGCVKPKVEEQPEPIMLKVELPDSLPSTITSVYMVGNFNNWTFSDDYVYDVVTENGKKMVNVELNWDNLEYPIQFKFSDQMDWAGVEKGPNGEELTNRVIFEKPVESKNLRIWNFADTSIDYSSMSTPVTVKFVVEVPENTPEASGVYIRGDLINSSWDGTPLTLNNGKYEVTLTLNSYELYQYKYVLDNDWAHVELMPDGTNDIPNRWIVVTDNETIVNKVHAWK